MRSDSIRLLVADDLRLGQPLRTSLPMSDQARDHLIDSTYRAWRQIQNVAVDREVDAIILNGTTLPADDFSAEAEQALREGMTLVLEAGIRIVLHPGNDESRPFWREFLSSDAEMADGVSLLAGTTQLQICRRSDEDGEGEHNDEEVIYHFVSIDDHVLPGRDDRNEGNDENPYPFTIGLHSGTQDSHSLPPGINLLISGGSAYWRGSHDLSLQQCLCAAPQALSREEVDPGVGRGCLVIELNGSGEVAVERRPTASVRFLECDLDLSTCRDWEDAALLLQNQIESISWEDLERVRLIDWSLTAADPLSLQLLEGSGVERLVSAWQRSFPLEDDLQIVHAFRMSGHAPHQWIDSQSDGETRELAEALFQQELTGENHRLDRLKAEWPTDEHSSRLWNRLSPHLRHAQTGRHAEALMSHWLKTSDPENLPYETHLS